MKKFIYTIIFLVSTILAYGQSEYNDVVYLKNGSVIYGKIIERVPDEGLTIMTADGSKFVFTTTEIEKMEIGNTRKEKKRKKRSNDDDYDEDRISFMGMTIGPSIPFGDFGNVDNNKPEAGIMINIPVFGYMVTDNIGVGMRWTIGANGTGENDLFSRWSHLGMYVGPIFSVNSRGKVNLDFKPMVGFLSAEAPDNSVFDEGESATALAFSGGIGLRFHFTPKFSMLLNTDVSISSLDYDNPSRTVDFNTFSMGVGGAYRF